MPERADRKRHVTGQFKRIGLKNVEFVQAIKPDDEGVFKRKGTHGCALSHRQLFHRAKRHALESILIFEDDVVFCEDFIEKISPILTELRTCDWDIFYFFKPRKGGHDLDGNRGDIIGSHHSGLVKTTGSIMTHAYAIHSRCIDLLIEKTNPEYMRDHIPFEIRAIDKAIAHLNLSCYACSTDLTYQNPDLHSSIKVES